MSTSTRSTTNELQQVSLSEVLVKKVLPYLALACIPLLSSTNAVMTRAAYIYVPEGKEKLNPFVLACLRMFQAFACFLFARWYRNEIMLRKFSSSSSSPSQPQESTSEKPMHTIDEAATLDNGSTVTVNVIQSLSTEDQERNKAQILKNPEHVSPALMDVLQAWFLGLLTCGNVFLFTEGIKLTDGTTTAAFMATIPPGTFIIGYALGLEKYSHSRAVATVLILSGNVVMNHLWRLVYTHDDESQQDREKHTTSYYLGALLLFVSCISASGYLVLQRPLSKRMSFLDFFVHMYGFAAVFAWFCTLFPRDNLLTHQLSTGLYPAAWGAILVGGILQCFVGFLLVAFVSNFIGSAVIVALFRASAPILIVLESILFLGEELDIHQVYGGILILFGVGFTLVPVLFSSSSSLSDSSSSAANSSQDKKKKSENEKEMEESQKKKNDDDDDDDFYSEKQESVIIATPTTVMPVSIPMSSDNDKN